MIADNSAEAYKRAFNTTRLNTLRYRVYMEIRTNPGIDDITLAKNLKEPINTVCPRIGELERAGLIVINPNCKNPNGNRARHSYPATIGPLDVIGGVGE